ncbi:MAG TPA: GntR family transcriptional regulator, partial [Clostridiaceae bacterium]|nr:GntR family transcriptional regulator [Clostridiaceae bacterium]
LDYKSREPIYIQLKQSIIQGILLGAYKVDDQLPAVRQLAADLGINPNTVQKAYRELEREGVIYSIPYKGSYVASTKSVESTVRTKMQKQFTDLVAVCRANGIGRKEIQDMFEEAMNEINPSQ